MKKLLGSLLVGFVALGFTASARGVPTASPKHVFVIVLENKSFDDTFGPSSPAPYLSKTLTSQGQLLTHYYGIGHESLDNYIAMVSGQAPNPVTQADCQLYQDFVPPIAVFDASGQAVGQGCVYPAQVPTLAGQMDAAGLTWRGYMEDMATPCRHPDIGTQDTTQKAKVGDQYAARHNPFVYFHSIIDDGARCAAHVVDLANLTSDLQAVSTTPNLSFITPNLCHDGHDEPCVDGPPGGLKSADAFLQEWVPRITSSPAFQHDGLLLVTFDEAETGGAESTDACCGEVPGPNSPSPGINGPGGGRTGAVVISPFTAPGTTNDTPYNHYALLRTMEDLFGLGHVGFAAASGLRAFGPDVFDAAAPTSTTTTATTAAPTSSPPTTAAAPTALARTGDRGPWPWFAVALAAALVALRAGTGRRRRARRL